MSLAEGNKDTKDDVKEYYGKCVKKTEDLKTSACTTPQTKMAPFVREALSMVHEEVASKYYGCGLVIPEVLADCSVLDLGSGAGRDCFMIAKLVGEKGSVTGIDMTPEQLEVANEHIDYHRQKFGYSQPNTTFVHGYIEQLIDAGLKPDSFDIIVSNCVVNLSPDKRAVLSEAYKVLKEGGEFYFSDVFADCILADEVRKHKVLWGECIAGALWWEDLSSVAKELGFTCPRLVTASAINVNKPEHQEVVKDARFASVTYRLFKLGADAVSKGVRSEVTYTGGIPGAEEQFKFDHTYTFQKDVTKVVDAETVVILQKSRFQKYFTVGEAKPSCCGGGKVAALDPFKYLESVNGASFGCCSGGGCC